MRDNRIVRSTKWPEDAEEIMKVFSAAKDIMVSSGNIFQWKGDYPSRDVVQADVERNGSFVVEEKGRIVAYFAFLQSPDPTYGKIYDGCWIDDKRLYHVVHRIASYPGVHGIFKCIMDFCLARECNIRIDTHRDNHIMRHNIGKHGFHYCGIIHLASGDERLAYQKIQEYTLERFSTDIDADSYIENFRRADYFIEFCKQCGNYGRRYGCPPFDDDPLTLIENYDRVRVLGVKITPVDKSLPLEAANDLMKPVTMELNEELLEMEKTLGGYSFGFVGTCPYCEGAACARVIGEPCRHPDKVRPSLEAIGFDMGKTAKELLGLDIKWSRGELIPEYLTLVCGLFYGTKEKPLCSRA